MLKQPWEWNTTSEPWTDCTPTDQQPTLPLAVKIIFGMSLVVIIILTILGNSVVCFIVHRKPSMRSAINLLLANMALSNILLATLVMPFAFVTIITDAWMFGGVMCRIVGFLHAVFVSEAVIMLLVISVDRYLIIVRRRDKLTPARSRCMIVCSWILTAGFCFPPTVGWGVYTSYTGWIMCVLQEYRNTSDKAYMILFYTVVFFLPVAILAFSYLSIIRTVHQRSLQIHNHPDEVVVPVTKIGLSPPMPPRLSVDFSFKMRAFKTIFILFVVFAICWTPYGTALTIWNATHNMAENYVSGTVVTWLGYLNSALNPIIYCWRIKKFRDACEEIIPRSLHLTRSCFGRARRRINPGAVYEHSDSQPTQLQELQVQSYLTSQ